MAALFSAVLWKQDLGVAGVYQSPQVPLLKVWVVRDIALLSPGGFVEALNGIELYDDATTPLFSIITGVAIGAKHYSWTGRQVLLAGDHINAVTGDDFWKLRISGYELSAP